MTDHDTRAELLPVEQALLPCPFCGSEPERINAGYTTEAVCCRNDECPAKPKVWRGKESVAAWNLRAAPPLPPAMGESELWQAVQNLADDYRKKYAAADQGSKQQSFYHGCHMAAGVISEMFEERAALPTPTADDATDEDIALLVDKLRRFASTGRERRCSTVINRYHAETLDEAAALIELLARGQTYGEGIEAAAKQANKFVRDFLSPWGSWKTAWWEGEVSDDAAFSADNALKHVANILDAALATREQGDGV